MQFSILFCLYLTVPMVMRDYSLYKNFHLHIAYPGTYTLLYYLHVFFYTSHLATTFLQLSLPTFISYHPTWIRSSSNFPSWPLINIWRDSHKHSWTDCQPTDIFSIIKFNLLLLIFFLQIQPITVLLFFTFKFNLLLLFFLIFKFNLLLYFYLKHK